MQKLMDSIYSNNKKSSRTPKLRNQNGPVSPLMIKYLNSCSNPSTSSSADPFSPPYNGKSSNNSGSPLSAVDGEDVLVMDGILVSSNNSGFYKTEVCRFWEDFGKCRFGAECQFAHGKEEVRPTRMKNKSVICKLSITESCLYGSKCCLVHQIMTGSPNKPEEHTMTIPKAPLVFTNGAGHTNKTFITPTAFKLEQPSKTPKTIAIKSEQNSRIPNSIGKAVQTAGTSSTTNVTGKDNWSPQDDGIEAVVLPSNTDNSPSRQNVDAYINSVLNQPSARRRLPVFAEICPQ